MHAGEVDELRELMCEIGRRIWQRGYCAGNEGNHSVRIGTDRFLCTPTGISKGFMQPDQLCVVNGAGSLIEAGDDGSQPSSELRLHLAIYAHRPDVNAVIHSHPPHAVAFCLAGEAPRPDSHPEAELFLGEIPLAGYATPGTEKLPASVLPLINERTNTVLMANHGSVQFGRDLMQTYYRLEILDRYCQQLLLARALGGAKPLSKASRAELAALELGR